MARWVVVRRRVLLISILLATLLIVKQIASSLGSTYSKSGLISNKQRSAAGSVDCAKHANSCGFNKFNLELLYDEPTAAFVLCSKGSRVVSVQNNLLAGFLHVVQVNSPKDAPDSVEPRVLLKSYGGDALYKLASFFEATPADAYVLLLVLTSLELPAKDLIDETEKIFQGSQLSNLKENQFYYALYEKHSGFLVSQSVHQVDRSLPKIHLSFCLDDLTPNIASVDGKSTSMINFAPAKTECVALASNQKDVLSCSPSEAPVRIHSHASGDIFSTFCINGQLIKYQGTQQISRGIHLIVFSHDWNFISYDVYDSYQESRQVDALSKKLNSLESGSIVFVTTHDEASNKLSPNVRGVLYNYGSSLISRLKYRDSWTFIGQKGMEGKTVYEVLNLNQDPNGRAKEARIEACVPKILHHKEWLATVNDRLKLFCENQGKPGFESVCRENITLPKHVKPPQDFDVFLESSPMLVVPDMALFNSHLSLFKTLISIVSQPNIKPKDVYVALGSNDFIVEFRDIVDVFGFPILLVEIKKQQVYFVPYDEALKRLFAAAPKARNAVIIQPEVTVAPDFMYYMYSTRHLLESHDVHRVASISGWNPNAFASTDFPVESLLRVNNNFPLPGLMIGKWMYEALITGKDAFKTCCTGRKWYEGWTLPTKYKDFDTVIPGVSRVMQPPVQEAYTIEGVQLMEYLNNRTDTSSIPPYVSNRVNFLIDPVETKESYKKWIEKTFSACEVVISDGEDSRLVDIPVEITKLKKCVHVKLSSEQELNHVLRSLGIQHGRPFGSFDGALHLFFKDKLISLELVSTS